MLRMQAWAWCKEAWRQITKQIAFLRYRTPPEYYRSGTEGSVPLVLLPGITNRWSTMKKFADRLSRAGYAVHVVGELGDNMHLVKDAARIVREYIERHDLHDAVFIAHSKGGMVGKYYLMHENGGARVLGMVSLGGPFGGSKPARLFRHEGYREMWEGSAILKELAADTEINARIVSIFPAFDTHLLIPHASFLTGALANIEIPTGGHNILLYDSRVSEATLRALSLMTERLRGK